MDNVASETYPGKHCVLTHHLAEPQSRKLISEDQMGERSMSQKRWGGNIDPTIDHLDLTNLKKDQ